MTNYPEGTNWWRGGVIYQIYPRSFQDSNGDGIGDLSGISSRLPYIAELGVDAIWLSPFFKSPMKDFGYDISDYRAVDPIFGTLEDVHGLVKRAHALGLKVMIDLVLPHTSDQHPWFEQSRSCRENPKADWYVWADARLDGSPPNNWLSIFGGGAWQWDTGRQQYYLHHFLSSQPALNFHNPQVQQAVLDEVRFWLDLGVDGYRLDSVNFYFHDRQLHDNPGRGMPDGSDPTVTPVNPYAWQQHRYDKSQPENIAFLQRLRALLDAYADTAMVGEIVDDDGLARLVEYTQGGDKLHMAYCFDLLGARHDAPYLHALFTRFLAIAGDGWPCWALSNHDVMRCATRWGGEVPNPRLLRLAAALQMTLRGTPCIYQGDELGLPEVDVAQEDLQDPYGIAMWPRFKGRDGCRTPMPWDANQPQGGFSSGRPWLAMGAEHMQLAVAQQGPEGLLAYYRQLLEWRRTQPALISGTMRMLEPHPQLLAFVREAEGQSLLCAFNFSDAPLKWTLPADYSAACSIFSNGGTRVHEGDVEFEPWGGLVVA